MFAKPRLGKTKIFLDWAALMRRSGQWARKGLMIVPRPIALDTWVYEAEKHSELKLQIVRQSLDEFENALEGDADLLVTPWSTLQTIFTEKYYDNRKKRNKRGVDLALVRQYADAFDLAGIDEIHTCKNPTTLRYKMADILTGECDMFMGLTGTPHGKNPFDLWAQAYLCDRGETLGRNFHFFKACFGIEKKNWFARNHKQWVFDKKKLALLNRRIQAISLSYGWEGNLDLPDVNRGEVRLSLTEEQQRHYNSAMKKLLQLHIDDKQDIENTFIRLRQISSGFIGYKDENENRQIYEFKSCSKLDWIEEFLEEAPTDAKIALFHEFTHTGEMISRHLKKLGAKYGWIYGKTKNASEILKRYQTGDIQVLVINNAVGNSVIDLSCTDYMAFIESPTSSTIREQAEARPMGSGRNGKPLMLDDIICSPVEQRVLDNAKAGKAMLSSLIFQEARKGLFDLMFEKAPKAGKQRIKRVPPANASGTRR